MLLVPPELLRDSFEETTVSLETSRDTQSNADGTRDVIIATNDVPVSLEADDIISVTSQNLVTLDLTQNSENEISSRRNSCKIGNNTFPLGTTIRNFLRN